MDLLLAAFMVQMVLYLVALGRTIRIAVLVRRIGKQWPLPYYLIATAAAIMTARRASMFVIYPPQERVDIYSYVVVPLIAAVLFFSAIEVLYRRIKKLLSTPEVLEDLNKRMSAIFHGKPR